MVVYIVHKSGSVENEITWSTGMGFFSILRGYDLKLGRLASCKIAPVCWPSTRQKYCQELCSSSARRRRKPGAWMTGLKNHLFPRIMNTSFTVGWGSPSTVWSGHSLNIRPNIVFFRLFLEVLCTSHVSFNAAFSKLELTAFFC